MTNQTVDRLRVLIVEDDPLALGGEQALTQLRTAQGSGPTADVVVTDLQMPGLSGLEVLREIRADASLRLVPVVVLSSSDRPEDVDAASQRGRGLDP